MSVEFQGILQTNIACLFKGEWGLGYSKSRPKAFTVSNINRSWAGSGLYPFQPRKVLRRALAAITPSPPSTPPPEPNVFNDALLMSSPSEMLKMHNANQALQVLL